MQESIFILALMLVFCFLGIVGAIHAYYTELSKQVKENRIILEAIRNYLSEQLKNNQK